MRNTFLILFITFFLPLKNLFSQTYLAPQAGTSLHSQIFESLEDDLYFSIINAEDKFAFSIGAHLEHYIRSKWAIRFGGFTNLQKHTYTIVTNGFIGAYKVDYNLANCHFTTGYKLLDNLELGVGIGQFIKYNRTFSYSETK